MTCVKEDNWYIFKYQVWPGAKRRWCIQTFGDTTWGDIWYCYNSYFFFKNEQDATMFALRWS